jgi:murein DD-endopeptidase MepM/ murein hydrolase activator NlpD
MLRGYFYSGKDKVRHMNLRRISTLVSLLMLIPISSANAAPVYVFPVAGCEVNYARAHHDYAATDILTKAGCKFVAPINGVVDEVNRTDLWSGKTNLGIDRGGLYVSIIGEDGVRYYGSHLRSIPASIQPGVSVLAGRLLGAVGATGSARGTAPHLHFGISWPTPADTWWVRRGEVLPWKYLDAWKKGKDLSPVKEVNARKLKVGEIPPVPKK